MKSPKSDTPLSTQRSPATGDDALSSLAAIAQEERAFAEHKEAVRRAAFEKLTGDAKAIVLQLTTAGFDITAIGKALGFSPTKSSPSTTTKHSGPTTPTAWFNLFRSRAIQTYLTTHPDLAARLKTDSIKSVDYPLHIPQADLESIDSQARSSADQRCPSTPSAS